MVNCWASCLSDCSDKQSREHIVSKSLFDSTELEIQGFAWCKAEPKRIGIGSATAKILCEHHNNCLSPVDDAAVNAFDALRQQTKLSNDRAKLPAVARLPIIRFWIDARLLERWLLKTLLNFSYQGQFLIGLSGVEAGVVPRDLVDLCFGRTRFQQRAGMYVASNVGMKVDFADVVAFHPLIRDQQRVLGGFFSFRGVRFFLCLMPEGLQVPIGSIKPIVEGWQDAELHWRFEKINVRHFKNLSHVTHFDWGPEP